MFTHTCSACHRRELIFPSQITALDTTERGIVVRFTCWCDAEQTMVSGIDAAAPTEAPVVTPAVAA
ncbi:hypothetical protein ASE01_14155 [Nocardioides sp. Root190]|uniref:hypothetical protein n=1 Tax=Nocardioides sp. Root190 TaxID=1736488 RepID=UPI0006F65E81|nr:hypothetical protein [Nocardioides sp. Root190]KRB76164.1 hypothetical protein ASE01_14155 [Nocardioides sp. Root190]